MPGNDESPCEYYCRTCGSTNISRDASVVWNKLNQSWEIKTIYDNASCEDCGGDTKLETYHFEGRIKHAKRT